MKGGGREQVLVRRLACANESPFLASTPSLCARMPLTMGIVQAELQAMDGVSFFLCPMKSLRFNLGLIG